MEMLHRPNVVEYYGIEIHRAKVYIVLQLFEDEGIIQVYTMQLLEGLAYLYSRGVAHQGIKPDKTKLYNDRPMTQRFMIELYDTGVHLDRA
ncbi:hypothetical protein NLJ89_g5076 [Agrocybe chaxingu]|uniref:Protein kinase domain-containing protein n=1 Tax=Agrocybe chaxingu TaxID=84603 RepID=A0A9W8K1I6_9AGAR|nr:hypothetical protein NLJ89_g5076 [Agrocybe chaxingu]